ncbi:MAG: 2-oxoacid:ferredoxin oxidoreductase subunit alpha [Candidatus Solincola sediminis]|uniref:2-oxoacid:ferredoxin oxidoreductase subunit alpha n=1 Tax=Candidatus Solincola sediminis TaxID=1797199 RepID=A0A1F2WNZ1_9ACTN|nr:MAG: 2-oxoacid:ferredoxin oxidoreductase subunit alpha [Candidatus Solincola sediminis]OFW61851.1 MAG: 2-oxoacid:ferredoxin oxidoreductase subunit alpha [Candidatus Solincola sediminis]
MDYTIKIGGEAGQGIQTIGDTLAKVFARSGYHVFSHQDYESRVRGGHNFYQIRFSEYPVMSSRSGVDILIALDKASIDLHRGQLNASGMIVYDSSSLKSKYEDAGFLEIPLAALAGQHGSPVMSNTAAIGGTLGMLGMQIGPLLDALEQNFRSKGADVVEKNQSVARAGYEYASINCPDCPFILAEPGKPLYLVRGEEAVGLGALAGGCRFYSAYPMTPSTGIMDYLAEKSKEYPVVVEQAEDEISAINMILGAAYAGVRSMTGTSGGGFSLMVEGLALAGMTETPAVICLGMRPGPATGFPTRTEQGELLFALFAGHGEFPRVVFAPGDPMQAIMLTARALDIANKYQIPAIILTDQHLMDSEWTFESMSLEGTHHTDYRLRGEELADVHDYRRYALTESGVSPFAVPGASENLVVEDSDEHDQDGHIVEDAETRNEMVRKRTIKKLQLIRNEIAPPLLYGSRDPNVILIGWGSTYGVIREVIDRLSPEENIAMMHFSQLSPFPDLEREGHLQLLNQAAIAICIENNATGQLAGLIRAETGFQLSARINKYDGRCFLLDDLLEEINDHLERLHGAGSRVVPGMR